MKINVNTLLFILGIASISGPDIKAVADWLTGSGIPHAIGVAHILGYVVTACGGLALMLPWLRKRLALLGLATPPGARAPWIPGQIEAAAPVAETPSSSAITTVEKIDPKKSA